MTQIYRKKLIEVAMPLEDINAASVREKSIRHGHPSTLHLWWARRPLATARAVLFAQLVDDPSGYVEELRGNASIRKSAENELNERLKKWGKLKTDYDKAVEAGMKVATPGPEPALDDVLIEKERERLFNLIRLLVLWENTNNENVLEPARAEIRRSWARTRLSEKVSTLNDKQISNQLADGHIPPLPPFLDPFAGGGAIPLEAQRLGLEAHASDLNPVAVLINKAMIEIPPKFAEMPPAHPEARVEKGTKGWSGASGLAEDVRRYGQWVRDEAFKRIGHLYPSYTVTQELIDSRPDLVKMGYHAGDQLTVIAWLWARTVPSPNPTLNGKHVPLASSFWLSKNKGKEAWVEPVIENGDYRFEVRLGKPDDLEKVDRGTKTGRANFGCLLSGVPISGKYVDTRADEGEMDTVMMAVVCEGKRGRVYLSTNKQHLKIVSLANPTWKPEQECRGTFASNAQGRKYCFKTFGDYFTDRQLVALDSFCDLLGEVRKRVLEDLRGTTHLSDNDSPLEQGGTGPTAYADAVAVYLAFAVDRIAMTGNSLVRWNSVGQKAQHCFGRQAIAMVWDFAEPNFFGTATGAFSSAYKAAADPLTLLGQNNWKQGIVDQKDAASQVHDLNCIISTDPPYYDNIGYADLSDFFYVWERRSLAGCYPTLFSTLLVPKGEELVATPYRHGGKEAAEHFFLSGMTKAMRQLLDSSINGQCISIYYAFKQSEKQESGHISIGWATFLSAILETGFMVCGTWPMRTEMATRQISMGTNALASSIVLICRQRPKDAPMATRREFVQALQRELPQALRDLQHGNIAPVDLPQSSIGPGMAVFSRYRQVLEADGSPMPVRTALQLINQAVDEFLSEQEAQMDDWTRFAVTWFSTYGFQSGRFGEAQNVATARNVSVEGVRDAGILESGGGKVRLLPVKELDPEWDPSRDTRLTIWEVVHHLIRRLIIDGSEAKCAALLKQVGGLGEEARALAYRLYTLADQKKWSDEARDYNTLITAWPELTKLAGSTESTSTQEQLEL